MVDELPPCEDEIYKNGKVLAVFANPSGGAKAVEAWIGRVREKSGQRVDWHYVAGRVVVKGLGDIQAIHAAMENCQP